MAGFWRSSNWLLEMGSDPIDPDGRRSRQAVADLDEFLKLAVTRAVDAEPA